MILNSFNANLAPLCVCSNFAQNCATHPTIVNKVARIHPLYGGVYLKRQRPACRLLSVNVLCTLAHGIDLQNFSAGSIPLRLGGIKSYDTSDDEVVVEVPILWGSDAQVGVHVSVCFVIKGCVVRRSCMQNYC
jgi:hypothetical protein